MDWPTLATFVLMLAFMLTFPSCQKAYVEHQGRLRADAWLFKQCQDYDFAQRMRQYTDSCEHVAALFEQSPWLAAAQKCLPSPSMLSTFALTLAVMLVPSVVIPFYRARQDMLETQRIMRGCSPFHTPIKGQHARGLLA